MNPHVLTFTQRRCDESTAQSVYILDGELLAQVYIPLGNTEQRHDGADYDRVMFTPVAVLMQKVLEAL